MGAQNGWVRMGCIGLDVDTRDTRGLEVGTRGLDVDTKGLGVDTKARIDLGNSTTFNVKTAESRDS